MTNSVFRNKIITDLKKPFANDYTDNLEQIAIGYTRLFELESKNQPLVITLILSISGKKMRKLLNLWLWCG